MPSCSLIAKSSSNRSKGSSVVFVSISSHPAVCRRTLSTISKQARRSPTRAASFQRSLEFRAYSVNGPTTTNTGTATKPLVPPIPVASQNGRKSVDLKPAPRKTTQSTAEPEVHVPIPSSVSTPAVPQVSTTSLQQSNSRAPYIAVAPPPSESTEPAVGILKQALNDIDEALRSGVLAPIPPGTTGWQLTWHKFKEMAKFYFFGLRTLTVEHRRQAWSISRSPEAARTWREREFLSIYRADLLRSVNALAVVAYVMVAHICSVFRLIPFISIMLIAEEALPIIIIYAPFLLPSTCKLPSQQRRIEALADEKRGKALIEARQILKSLPPVEPGSGLSAFDHSLYPSLARYASCLSRHISFSLTRSFRLQHPLLIELSPLGHPQIQS